MGNGLRLVLHPDQYVVLSSDSESVVANSIKILTMHANLMDMLGQPRTEWAAMTIHGGKSDRSDKLVEVISELPEGIRNRIVLENDEYAYSSEEILDVCVRSGVPMIFDAHHHVCHEGLDSFDHPSVAEYFWKARDTWADPANQMVHISNGRTHFNDRAHSDLIFNMPEVFRNAPWIEVEAKHKELAIGKLKDEWIDIASPGSATSRERRRPACNAGSSGVTTLRLIQLDRITTLVSVPKRNACRRVACVPVLRAHDPKSSHVRNILLFVQFYVTLFVAL